MAALAGAGLARPRRGRAAPARLAASAAPGWAAGIWWLFISLHRYGGLPAWLAVLAVALLCAGAGAVPGAGLALFARWRRGRVGARRPAVRRCCGCWPNWRARVIFTGFPWLASGYAQVDGPLAALGAVGRRLRHRRAAARLLAALLAAAWHRRRGRGSAGVRWRSPLLVLALSAALGAARVQRAQRRAQRARCCSPTCRRTRSSPMQHVPQALAWVAQALERRARRSGGGAGDGGAAAARAAGRAGARLLAGAARALRAAHAGGADRRAAGRLSTAATPIRWSACRPPARGRRAPTATTSSTWCPSASSSPPGFRWFTELMNIPLGDFTRGPLNAPSFSVGGRAHRAQHLLRGPVRRRAGAALRRPGQAPTIFANVSNIGWFGDTIAVDQHLHISRMRTLEFQRPMLRATNTGATAVIDHRGQVQAQLPPFTQGVLEGRVQGRARADTLRALELAFRPVALAGAGRRGDRAVPRRAARRPARSPVRLGAPDRRDARPARVPRRLSGFRRTPSIHRC